MIAERARFAVDECEGETVAEYAKRWCEWREARGFATVIPDRAFIRFHITPVIGALPIRSEIGTARRELETARCAARWKSAAQFHGARRQALAVFGEDRK